MTANNTCAGKDRNALAAKKTLVGSILLLLSLVACSTQNFSSEAATQTVVARSQLLEGLYLVMDGEPVPLDRQIQVGGKGIDVSQVPQANESHPVVLLKATDDQVVQAFNLLRMVGGVGLRIAQVDDSGGVVVGGTTKGYSAEVAGLQKDDIVVAIDGQILAELSREDEYAYLDDVGRLIAGELGTSVDFTVQRGGAQLDLTLVRDFPTKLPDSKHWAFSAEKVPEGHFRLTPAEPLADGLYCYWRYQPSRMPGDFYCFFVGDDA